MTSAAVSSFSYSIFTFEPNDRGTNLPVGVALWSAQGQACKIRWLQEGERLTGMNSKEHYPIIRLMQGKVEHWIAGQDLPYGKGLSHFEDEWWRHLQKLLVHQVRLTEPRSIDCHDPANELEPLFESIVGPFRSARKQRARLKSEINRCLGRLAKQFDAQAKVPGFGGRDVEVDRAFKGKGGYVIIEGVNLGGSNAELLSDAVASKLLRLRDGVKNQTCEIIVAYLTSPHGLNGESVLVDWIQRKTEAKAFDLLRQRELLSSTAADMVSNVEGQSPTWYCPLLHTIVNTGQSTD